MDRRNTLKWLGAAALGLNLPALASQPAEREIDSPVEAPPVAPALEESTLKPRPADSLPESAPAVAAHAEPQAPPQQRAADEAAPEAPSEPPPAAARTAGPLLVSIASQSVRRGAGVTVLLRGDAFSDSWSVQFRRGGKGTSRIRILRSKRTGPGELELSLLPEEDAPIGTYSLVLIDSSGASTNALPLAVDL